MMRAIAAGLLLATAGAVSGQENPFWQPEVRRALPVEKSSPTPEAAPQREIPTAPAVPADNPAWMQRVQPSPTPAGPEPGFTPYRPQGRIEVAPTPADENGDIRLSPGGPTSEEQAAEAELALANSVYARKMYDYAATEYEKFLIAHPRAKSRDMALFRLAECHRMLGNDQSARDGYERLLMEFREGEFAGSGAYRLGEYLYGEKKYESAATQFDIAAKNAASDEVRLSARYNLARCYDRLNRSAEAAKMYADVAAIEKNNPYREYAMLAVAQADASAGRKPEALEKFGKIAAGTGAPAVRAEAAVKAAALAAELGNKKQAVKLFTDALNLKGSGGEWNSVAYLGAMRLYYDLGDYKKVEAMSDKPPEGLPDEAKAEVLLLAANSYRQAGNQRAARAIYDRLLIQFPDSAPSQDARFHRLVSMYQLDDPKLIAEIDSFLNESKNPKEIAQASLLKAEALFKNQKYAEAGPIYARLLKAEISGELKTKSLFKLGWCQGHSGDPAGAAQTFSEYIQKNPKASNIASALIQRGLALQANKQYVEALKDFDLVAEKYKGEDRELALQQKALILGQQQDYKGMIATFRQLLADYPKSSAAGQANFWIGWAAFEDKNYKGAVENLETARKLDTQYAERATLRLILCHYYLEDRAALERTIAENNNVAVPVEITRWLGRKSFDEGNYAAAEQYLLPVMKDEKAIQPDVLIELAEAQIRQGKSAAAAAYVDKYLETARDPRSRARGLQAKAAVVLAGRDFDGATKLCEESILLQPEGRLNAEGRLLTGEIAFAKGDYVEAARAFMTVAVLYDDPSITPRALGRAAVAYRKADNLIEADKATQELRQRFPDFQKSARVSKGN